MLVTAWQQVTPSTIEACFRKCLEDPKVQIDPVPVPPDFTRSAWESQIDLEEFTEEEIELEIQEIIQKNQSMASDPAEPEKENLMTTTVAMTAARRLRSYFQCQSAPLEVLQALGKIENQLLKDKVESKTTKQTTIESFSFKTHHTAIGATGTAATFRVTAVLTVTQTVQTGTSTVATSTAVTNPTAVATSRAAAITTAVANSTEVANSTAIANSTAVASSLAAAFSSAATVTRIHTSHGQNPHLFRMETSRVQA